MYVCMYVRMHVCMYVYLFSIKSISSFIKIKYSDELSEVQKEGSIDLHAYEQHVGRNIQK